MSVAASAAGRGVAPVIIRQRHSAGGAWCYCFVTDHSPQSEPEKFCLLRVRFVTGPKAGQVTNVYLGDAGNCAKASMLLNELVNALFESHAAPPLGVAPEPFLNPSA